MLIIDPQAPTGIGNSVSSAMTPDLTFTKNVADSRWSDMQESLGSGHYIVVTTVQAGVRKKRDRELKLVDWESFRKIRQEDVEETITHIKKWTEKLQQSVKRATKSFPQAEIEEVGSRFYCTCGKRKLVCRKGGKKQKHNRKLRKRIAELDKEIELHANRLSQQNWEATCNLMERQVGISKTWNILRVLFRELQKFTLEKRTGNSGLITAVTRILISMSPFWMLKSDANLPVSIPRKHQDLMG